VKSLSLKEIPHPFNAMKIHVIYKSALWILIAGLTIGDPVYRTGNPLSVELGPGISFFSLINNY
jgi:hypothetical protein